MILRINTSFKITRVECLQIIHLLNMWEDNRLISCLITKSEGLHMTIWDHRIERVKLIRLYERISHWIDSAQFLLLSRKKINPWISLPDWIFQLSKILTKDLTLARLELSTNTFQKDIKHILLSERTYMKTSLSFLKKLELGSIQFTA